jgi:hypothetical protein
MSDMKEELIKQLNAEDTEQRIAAAKELKAMISRGEILLPEREVYTNNHVHTTYSFSPYSPSKAVWMALMSGLSTVGIIDHDAINGAEEFIRAGEILGMPTTIGFEMRTDWSATPLNGKRINNPDQISSAYICAHGLLHTQIANADAFLKPVRIAREKRNRKMICNLNAITGKYGITVDYDNDVLPLSCAKYGGEVTERHLLFALVKKLIAALGRGEQLRGFISGKLGIGLSDTQKTYLDDENNAMYDYDVLNIFKGSFVSSIYEEPSIEETPDIRDAVRTIKKLGAIPSYCYLGDIAASPTGDKKAQTFEDAYLDSVFEVCKDIGFQAIAYMPSRNTTEQLERVMALCEKYGFMQISGEDINQPRQSFICRQLKDPRFVHLIDSTWALVGHEKAATGDINKGMFADDRELNGKQVNERVMRFKELGLKA